MIWLRRKSKAKRSETWDGKSLSTETRRWPTPQKASLDFLHKNSMKIENNIISTSQSPESHHLLRCDVTIVFFLLYVGSSFLSFYDEGPVMKVAIWLFIAFSRTWTEKQSSRKALKRSTSGSKWIKEEFQLSQSTAILLLEMRHAIRRPSGSLDSFTFNLTIQASPRFDEWLQVFEDIPALSGN